MSDGPIELTEFMHEAGMEAARRHFASRLGQGGPEKRSVVQAVWDAVMLAREIESGRRSPEAIVEPPRAGRRRTRDANRKQPGRSAAART